MRPLPNPSDKHRPSALLIPVLWVMLSLLWIDAFVLYKSLPKQIPVQFDFAGKVIRNGHKITLFLLPVICSFIMFGFGNNHRVEHIRGGSSSTKNQMQVLMGDYLKFTTILLGFIFLYQVKRTVETPEAGWPNWIPIVFILLLISPIVILMVNRRQ
jgi:hypothetical protein